MDGFALRSRPEGDFILPSLYRASILCVLIGFAVAASAQDNQFAVLSTGTFDLNTLVDNETVTSEVGLVPTFTTLTWNLNDNTGVYSSTSGDLGFSFTFNSVDFQGITGEYVSTFWSYDSTISTGVFANLTGGGGDFSFGIYNPNGQNIWQCDTTVIGVLTPNPAPEPASLTVLGIGGIALLRRRARRVRTA